MPIHIAPIGEHTEHVIEWLRDPVMTNIGALTKIYLIHSKKGKIDFPRKAKDLEKKIKSNYAGVEVIKRVIGNPLHIDDTLEEIIKIIYDELEDESIINKEIAINVTGGTNAMAAAAILAATMRGTKAYYVLDRRMNPRQKSYVEELPVPSIGVAEMNTNAKKVLDLIDDASKDSQLDEDFTPIIEQDGELQDFDNLSGGEKTSVSLAYRLSLNTMMRRNTESLKSNLLILDEPTDGFSKSQLSKVRDVLKELGSEQIILVSHERELETYVDNIFQVSKSQGYSKIKRMN